MNAVVSVVIPVYNTGSYLEKCIRSVQLQNNVSVEIITVDDGSTDNSLDILYRLKEEYHNITIVENKHGGASSARNAGLKRATGEYISFLDSDDWLDLSTYTTAITYMNELDLDIFFFDWMEEYYDGSSSNKQRKGEKKYVWSNDEILEAFFLNRTNLRVSSCLLRRDTLNNVRFDEGRVMGEDMLFIFQALCNARRIAYVDLPLYHRFHRVGSISNVIGFNRNKFGQAEVADIMMTYVERERKSLLPYAQVYVFNFYMQMLNLIVFFRAEKQNQDIYEKVTNRLQCLYMQMNRATKSVAKKFCYSYKLFLFSKYIYWGGMQIYYRVVKREFGTKRQRKLRNLY